MTLTQPTPLYRHDCDCCHYLGRHTSRHHGEMDLYVHTTGTPTVVARFSDEGGSYLSGLYAGYGRDADLTETRRRAEAAGLLEYDVYLALEYAHGVEERARLRRELVFTEEYQAYLAFQTGRLERARFLVAHCYQLALAKWRKFQPPEVSVNEGRWEAYSDMEHRLTATLVALGSANGLALWQRVAELTEDLVASLPPLTSEDAAPEQADA